MLQSYFNNRDVISRLCPNTADNVKQEIWDIRTSNVVGRFLGILA